MRRISKLFPALLLVMNLTTACSTQKTVTTHSVQNDPHTGEPVTIEKTTTTNNSGAGAAVWSGTLSLLETVVLLPVRAVGILIHAIL
jgi:hypothetical protein